MSGSVPVTRSCHGDRRWRRSQTFEFARSLKLCGLVLAEIEPIALSFPMGFTLRHGRLFPVIILANADGESLYVGPKGQWLANYLPALLRSYPFRIKRDENEHFVLHVDEGSGLVVDTKEDGELFFEGHEPSQAIKDIQAFLETLEVGRQQTAEACSVLQRLGLLTDWPSSAPEESDDFLHPAPFSDLLRIDQSVLSNLDAPSLHALHQSGGLRLAILQKLSERHLGLHKILTEARKKRQTLSEQDAEEYLENADEKLAFAWDD
ncbi:SapC [Thiorhodovibrio winogradskyi]|uniref:SapC n=1 Tax=Thiorhodovibrio winogradskyi TaxID=77007 RepID=A0ABZ0SDM2_9GAMM|nr:SapC family protein [Thiorhodovibrio winogradskyi]